MSAPGEFEVDGETTPKRELSEKELAARRANAQKSTGPKTPEGKARVRENAMTHGAYAKKVTHISHGPLAEDRAEVEAFYAEMFDDLDPQTAVERALAREIATVAWGQERTERFTNLALSAITRPNLGGLNGVTQAEWNARRYRLVTTVLENLDTDYRWADFEEVVSMLFCSLPDGTATPGWVPDKGIRPNTPDAWRDLIELLLSKRWGTAAVAARWTGGQAETFEAELAVEKEDRAQLAARIALTDGILDKAMNMTGRLRRDFIRLLEQYTALKAA